MPRPMIVLYRKIAFSTMLRLLKPDDLCHSRRPSLRMERMFRFLCFKAADGRGCGRENTESKRGHFAPGGGSLHGVNRLSRTSYFTTWSGRNLRLSTRSV